MNALPIPLPCRLRHGLPARLPRGLRVLVALLVLLLAAPALRAQESEAADPPARVGSISALRGPVDFAAQSGAAWDAARLNQPVTGQSALWAPPGSQAEVRIGSTSVRLDGNTQAVFSQLDDHGVAIDLAQGSVRARLRSLPAGDAFSLAADGVRADAQMPGDYRADYDPDRRLLTLRAVSGLLRVVTPTGGVDLQSGQEAQVAADGTDLQLRAMGPRDEFDGWAEARDGEQDRLTALRYVSPEMTGVESLDAYGHWEVSDDYGPIWYPGALAAGWAPYRYGHWAWVAPWGWTWIDDAPWGFAPFHYGRWARVGSRWGWMPGPIVARPVWAPALVGYVGGQPSSGLSISIGVGAPVGWFPLGPYETFQPCYRHSAGYGRLINEPHWRHRHPDRHGRDGRDKDDRDRHGWRDRDGRDRDGRDWKDRDGKDRDDRDRHGGDGRNRDDDDRRMTRQPVPDHRYARLAEAVTVARAEDFRHSRPIGRQRIALDARQAAQLSPLVARLQEGGADGPKPRTPRERDGRDVREGAADAPVALLPAPPLRAARERDPRDRDERGRTALRDPRPGGAPPEARGRRDADGAPRAGPPPDRRVPSVARPPAERGDARGLGDARDAADAGDVRGARDGARDALDGRDARDARGPRSARDDGPPDARDARDAREALEARDARDARDAGGAAASDRRHTAEPRPRRDGRDSGPAAVSGRDAFEPTDARPVGRREPPRAPLVPALRPAPDPRDDRPTAGAPHADAPVGRPAARPEDRPRAAPPAPARLDAPGERRDAPRAAPETARGRALAPPPRVERPERPAIPAPRERDVTRGAPERRGAVAPEPLRVAPALGSTPPVHAARPTPPLRAHEAPPRVRPEPMEPRREARPPGEGGRGRVARQER